jgi:hypothetical protein
MGRTRLDERAQATQSAVQGNGGGPFLRSELRAVDADDLFGPGWRDSGSTGADPESSARSEPPMGATRLARHRADVRAYSRRGRSRHATKAGHEGVAILVNPPVLLSVSAMTSLAIAMSPRRFHTGWSRVVSSDFGTLPSRTCPAVATPNPTATVSPSALQCPRRKTRTPSSSCFHAYGKESTVRSARGLPSMNKMTTSTRQRSLLRLTRDSRAGGPRTAARSNRYKGCSLGLADYSGFRSHCGRSPCLSRSLRWRLAALQRVVY